MHALRKNKKDFFSSAAIFAVVATCFVLPFATSLLSLFTILVFLFWLLSGKFIEIPHLIKTNSVIFFSLVLMAMFVIGITYSPAEFSSSLSTLKKYRELLFIPIVISLLRDNQTARKNCEYSFITGCVFLLLISYAMYFSVIPAARYGNSIVYHITHSFFMSILAFWSIHKTIDSLQYRYFWLFLFFLTVFNLFYIATGRTGMLIFLVLMILFVIQRLSRLQQMIGVFLLTLLLSITFFTSDNFSSRSSIALKEIQNYEYGASRTSLGMRFDWWINSLTLIKEKPMFGHGTGSFTDAHNDLISKTKIIQTDNPHNEYLLIGVQLGVLGLLVFILLLISMLICSFKLAKNDRMYVQGVIMAMAVGCFMNSFLFDTHQGHFFAFLTAVYFSSSPLCQLSLRD